MLDALLIHPSYSPTLYQSLSKNIATKEPPVWLGLVAGFLKGHGFAIEILDANALNYSHQEAAEVVEYLNPSLVIVDCYGHQPAGSTANMSSVRELCLAIKNHCPTIPILLFGGHAASLPERTLVEEPVDYVCTSEGFLTSKALLEAHDPSKTPDLVYFEDEILVKTKSAPLLMEDKLPSIPWHMLPMDQYRSSPWFTSGNGDRSHYAAIYTSLGCPFKCSFCCIQAPFRSGERASEFPNKRSYRKWNTASVLKEIDTLVQTYGIKKLRLLDELFVLNKQHVNAICNGLIERAYDLDLWVYGRVDTTQDEQWMEHLQHAGITWIALGIETAAPSVQKDIHKILKATQTYNAVKSVHEAGINLLGDFIFGLPEDTHETMTATYQLAVALEAEMANFYCATALPGSELYERALREKWDLPTSWDQYGQLSKTFRPLGSKYLAPSEVLRFRDWAWVQYFKEPTVRQKITERFGYTALQQIDNIAATPFTRDILQ